MFDKLKYSFAILFIYSNLYAVDCASIGDVKEWGGHYYTITKNRVTWQEANSIAESLGGYLAIPNSQSENDFLKSLIPTPKYAWIGVYDPQYTTNYCYSDDNCLFDDSRFRDIKGNALSYTNWAYHQPDNLVKEYDIQNGKQMVSPLGEHWVAMSSIDGKWADFGNHFDEYNNPVKFYALIEFDKMPDCFTPTNDDNVNDYSKPQCNTQIYDDKTGTISNGKTYDCLKDPNGNYYCPAGLAPCSDEWDYKDGYSEEYVNDFNETTNKVCDENEININGKCYLDKNKDGEIDSPDKYPIKVDYWTYTQHQNGSFYRYTEKYLRYRVKMSINWGGDDWHFGAKIKDRGRLVWSRLVFPRYCYYNYQFEKYICYANGGKGVANVSWIDKTSYMLGRGDFVVKDTSGMSARTNWRSEKNLANVIGNYFFIFFRDGGSYVANDYITINFYTNNGIPPFDGATPVNPVYCPSGYQDDGSHLCYRSPSVCPSGYQDNGNTCIKTIEYTYYKYLCSGTNEYGNAYTPQDSGGDCHPQSTSDLIDTNGDGIGDSCNSPNPPHNNCKAETYKCVPAPDRKCVQVDNQWQCSPFPCFGEGVGDYNVEDDDTPVGINDKNNNGWSSSGQCLGQIYIFNGKDYRCRSDDVAGGLTGGGCCDKDKVFLGLISCKAEEKILAKKRENDLCHYVGEYCSKKLKFLGGSTCLQHKKTYCCFNSKLARIINEQGREQLGINWGSAKSPNCRGFKPDEFAKLDFSKMDLSEFYNQISDSISSSVMQNINEYIQNSVENQLNNAIH